MSSDIKDRIDDYIADHEEDLLMSLWESDDISLYLIEKMLCNPQNVEVLKQVLRALTLYRGTSDQVGELMYKLAMDRLAYDPRQEPEYWGDR